MAILPIVTYNDPILLEETKPVNEENGDLQTLIDDMFETMYNASGVGLAAPQIGRSIQLFVVDADTITEELEEPDLGPMVFINPEIVWHGDEIVRMEEGCLSIPDVRDEVKRPAEVSIRYLTREFKTKEQKFDGWVSRIVQHEFDHLRGKLFLDHLSAFRRRMHRSKLKKIEVGSFETGYPLVPKSKTQKYG